MNIYDVPPGFKPFIMNFCRFVERYYASFPLVNYSKVYGLERVNNCNTMSLTSGSLKTMNVHQATCLIRSMISPSERRNVHISKGSVFREADSTSNLVFHGVTVS